MLAVHRQASGGCYYAVADYASVSKRILALIIDSFVIVFVWVIAFLVVDLLALHGGFSAALVATIVVGFPYLYFVEFERSRLRTVGFRFLGLEVVDLRGGRPSRMQMITRLGMVWLGPVNLLLDSFWIPEDPNRQALRDKFAGTYVIRRGRTPLGHGPVKCSWYFFWGMDWVFREVARSDADGASGRPRYGPPECQPPSRS